jgi:hypothetical protein
MTARHIRRHCVKILFPFQLRIGKQEISLDKCQKKQFSRPKHRPKNSITKPSKKKAW